MSRRKQSLVKRLGLGAALALCAAGAAMADDSSISRFGGDSYAYFNNQPATRGAVAGITAWRRNHPNGLTELELQAVSSSNLASFAEQLNPPVIASAAADPAWRQSHPRGLSERELQALSSSSLAAWQSPDRSGVMANIGGSPSNETVAARVMKFLNSGGGARARAYE
jgi:hypothetical protein